MRLADFAAARPHPDALRAAGFDGVIRYLCNSPDRGLPNKILLPDEARTYLDRAMPVVSNWQRGKHSTADWKRGHLGGVDDARQAQNWHLHCGGPAERPIYFSVDEDVPRGTWDTQVRPYLRGCAEVLGHDRVGVYGGQRSMWWAAEDGYRWRWQTKAWSRYDGHGGWHDNWPVQWVPGCQLRQERVDQDRVDGIGVDVNTTHADDFGQWQAADDPAVWRDILTQLIGPRHG